MESKSKRNYERTLYASEKNDIDIALAGEAQPGEVGPQGLVPIPVPQRLRQPLHVVTEPSLPSIARFGYHALTLAWYPSTRDARSLGTAGPRPDDRSCARQNRV